MRIMVDPEWLALATRLSPRARIKRFDVWRAIMRQTKAFAVSGRRWPTRAFSVDWMQKDACAADLAFKGRSERVHGQRNVSNRVPDEAAVRGDSGTLAAVIFAVTALNVARAMVRAHAGSGGAGL